MKIVNHWDVNKFYIKSQNKWAVLLWSDISLYQLIQKEESGRHLPSWNEYVKKVFPEHEIQFAIIMGYPIFFFDSEDEATEFFKRVPDGSLINAELYSPEGEFQDDNT